MHVERSATAYVDGDGCAQPGHVLCLSGDRRFAPFEDSGTDDSYSECEETDASESVYDDDFNKMVKREGTPPVAPCPIVGYPAIPGRIETGSDFTTAVNTVLRRLRAAAVGCEQLEDMRPAGCPGVQAFRRTAFGAGSKLECMHGWGCGACREQAPCECGHTGVMQLDLMDFPEVVREHAAAMMESDPNYAVMRLAVAAVADVSRF